MKKNKRFSVLIILVMIASLSYAHEFWLEPMKFLLRENEKIRVNLMVGEDYKGEHSNGLKYKILKLDHYSTAQPEDIRKSVTGDSLSHFDVAYKTAGNHLIAFSNTAKFIELEAAKFNDYLRSEGLDDVARLRQQKNDTLKAGKELYQRCVKTLLQVGGKNDLTYAANTGMKLEIIPSSNPYNIKMSSEVTFRILFEQKPVVNGLVLAWHVEKGKTTHTSLRSNKVGEVTFPISKTGKWMISTVHMVSNADSSVADWQSFWGSYTFGYF